MHHLEIHCYLVTKETSQHELAENIKDCAFKRNFKDLHGNLIPIIDKYTEMVMSNIYVCVCVHFPVPNGPPTDLVVFNETTTSLNARWNPAPGRVQNYRITYVPTSGGRSQTVSLTAGAPHHNDNFVLLSCFIRLTEDKKLAG